MHGNITRRGFLKGGVAVGGAVAAAHFLYGGVETLVGTSPASGAAPELSEELVPTVCWIGKQDCGVLARRVGGRVVKLEGNPAHPRNAGTLCPKGMAQISALYDPNRVRTPLIRTNEKGVPGQFRQATWDEALGLVAERIKAARAKNPKLVLWQKGRSKAEPFYDTAFVATIGAEKLHHGAFCSDAGYRACEYTVGLNGVLHPDYRHTRYVLHWGYNLTNAGGNKLCWITYPRQWLEAKANGARAVVIDPRLHGVGPHTDDWLPVRPGSDLALALALCHEVVGQGAIDVEYLTRYTNAPFLVGENGRFVRAEGKELVWDTATNTAVPFDQAGVRPALEGSFVVGGARVRPAFQVLKEHLSRYSAEWAADICGVPATAIRRLAADLVENARIGATTVVDGVTVPYRPVAIHTYHMAQQELGFQTVRAMLILMMLLGAVGAVGGQQIDFTWTIHANFAKWDTIQVKDPPYNVWLESSKYFPLNSNSSAVVAMVLQDPQRWGVETLPEVMIVHMTNPVLAFGSQKDIIDGFKRIPFIAVIDAWLSKTADLLADVVLPAATLEKYEGPSSAGDLYLDAVAVRLPIMEPLGESRGEIDIYLDLCEKLGLLYGPDGYLARINQALNLKEAYRLPLDRRPAVRDIFDRWARSQGLDEGIAYFERNGVWVKGNVPPTRRYGYVTSPPFGGVRHRLYGESLLRLRDEMRAKGADEVFWRDYTPLPEWRPPTMERSPAQYDLYLVTFKLIEFKQGRGTQLPLVAELAPRQRLWMNPATAQARGIREGDEVWVESHNAVTGETKRIKVRVTLTQAIRPDTVGLPHHYGETARHPWTKAQGPAAAELLFTGPGYVANTADQSFHTKVRVFKA